MESVDYKERLKQFNATPKYKRELDFLIQLINPKKNDRIIDYGCGLGVAVELIKGRGHNVRGYDINYYWDKKPDWLLDGFPHCDVVYFMHSLAHIEKPEAVLKTIRAMLSPGGRVVVITPNRAWMDVRGNPDYIPDPTVKQHFDLAELQHLFLDAGFTVPLMGQFGEMMAYHNERLFLVATK